VYFALYLGYLFATLEGEWGHWGTMVLVPLFVVMVFVGSGNGRLRRALASLGLEWGRLRRGVAGALMLGLAAGIFQILASSRGDEIVAVLSSLRAFVVLPITLAFLLITAAFTEEFLFRGFLQTRLERLTGSKWAGLILASVLFGFYHLPYAYLHPRWPSHGDWTEALVASLGQGIPGGLVLGGLFLYSGRNLVAPILLHAFINLLPASTLLKFSGG
jgi:membrane protease YdiL (CAAX protease family)